MENTTYCNKSFLLRLPTRDYNYSFGGIMAFISFLATFENGALLVVFFKYQPVRKPPSNKLLLSMVVSDMLTGVTVGPLYSAQSIDQRFIYNCFALYTRLFLATVFMGTSLIIVAFISIDRAHHLMKLQNYKMKDSVLYSLIAFSWIIPLLTTVVGFMDFIVMYSMVVSFVGIMVFLIIAISYTILIIALMRKHHNIDNNVIKRSYISRQRAAAKTSFLIVTVNILMVLHTIFERIVLVCYQPYRSSTERPICLMCSLILVMGNSAVNPLIYCARIPTIRTHLVKMFRCNRQNQVPQERKKPVCVINGGEH